MDDEADCASFFDRIDDLIDFPFPPECKNADIGDVLVNSGDCNNFPSTWNGTLHDSGDISHNSASDISTEISIPHDEIAHLEWLSAFSDDSFSDFGLNPNKEDIASPFPNKEDNTRGPQRARSKRLRPPAFSPRPKVIRPVETFENMSESSPSDDTTKNVLELSIPERKKKRKNDGIGGDVSPLASNVRMCMHCEMMKTPQWRAGPMGPKTLCNACGVRFNSGRLFPEYRPAASPTFVPAVHSNSHKKVLEMRSKVGQGDRKPHDSVANNA